MHGAKKLTRPARAATASAAKSGPDVAVSANEAPTSGASLGREGPDGGVELATGDTFAEHRGDTQVPVEQQGSRDGVGWHVAEAQHHPAGRVVQARVGEVKVGHKGAGRVAAVADVHPEKRHAEVAGGLPGCLQLGGLGPTRRAPGPPKVDHRHLPAPASQVEDRKSTRLNSSHEWISYAVFCLKKKKRTNMHTLMLKKKRNKKQ